MNTPEINSSPASENISFVLPVSLSERVLASAAYVALSPLLLCIVFVAIFLEDSFVRTHARRALYIVLGAFGASVLPFSYLMLTLPGHVQVSILGLPSMQIISNQMIQDFSTVQVLCVILVFLIILAALGLMCLNAIKAIRGKI